MQMEPERFQELLNTFQLAPLFNELGWDRPKVRRTTVRVGAETFDLTPIGEKHGVMIYECSADAAGQIPKRPVLLKIEKEVTKLAYEHLLVVADRAQTMQTWVWVARQPGRPAATRTHTWYRGSSGESLRQKLEMIAFTLNEEEGLTLSAVTVRLRDAFNRDTVTRRFYGNFARVHQEFVAFIEGIQATTKREWYASLMLNRLMFVYFIQRKGFLDGNFNYLGDRLQQVRDEIGQGQFHSFYRHFLRRLFHEGLGQHADQRSPELERLLGSVPYLNGGLFALHQLEEEYPEIDIPDEAFERLFDFFQGYDWHLDDRPLRDGNEINPDVLGYIFEKYINQKQMGAYYTKEDITEYISKNTLIPFLLNRAHERCRVAFDGDHSLWSLLREEPDRYIYPAMRTGVIGQDGAIVSTTTFPDSIQAALMNPVERISDRTFNLAEARFALPDGTAATHPEESWREYADRRQRCLSLRERLQRGEVRDIDSLVTLNIDIRQFMQDVVDRCEGPDLLRALWQAIVGQPADENGNFRHGVSILDPTCGSGAFLFAALNVLEPLYEACLERMASFVQDAERENAGHRYPDFREILNEVDRHPSRRYYIYKSIIVHNLFGVDIMAEAVEICKLRLFLKLVSQVDRSDQLTPLPDIDFNIRPGNTLIGYTSLNDVREGANLASDQNALDEIERQAAEIEAVFEAFHDQQTVGDGRVDPNIKRELRDRLGTLSHQLNQFLAIEYGVNPASSRPYKTWQESHQPFHWFAEFHGIMAQGGFDVVIGNPPYVELRKVRATYRAQGYSSEPSGNLYALCMERCTRLTVPAGAFGMIVPAGLMGLDDSRELRHLLQRAFPFSVCSTYAIRPSKLFEGVDQRLCIFLGRAYGEAAARVFTSRYHHWNADERSTLFDRLFYQETAYNHRLDVIPQLGHPVAARILAKLEAASNATVKNLYARAGEVINYHRSPRYWIRALDFEPFFRSATSTRSVSHVRDLVLRDGPAAKLVGSIVNSTLFFLWFLTVGNGRNLTGRDLEEFPVILDQPVSNNLQSTFDELMQDIRDNSFVRERADCSFQEFRISKSKPIVDRLDRELAAYYGFDDEELDFIINFEIKYRLGGGDDEES